MPNDTGTPAAPGTALTVAERAAVALGAAEHEKKLIELTKQSAEITAITNKAGYDQCHSTRMSLKRARISIEATGKTAREDAQAFSKAVIAEERRLIGIIEPEEARLQGIQDAHDAEVERKKAAAAQAERERVERIQATIRDIRGSLIDVAGRSAAIIEAKIKELVAVVISAETAQEFEDEAEAVREQTLAKLREMHAAAVEQEAHAAQLKAEREELDRRQAEQAERERQERERVAAENLRREQEQLEQRRAFEAQQAAMSEIQGIQQQVVIAQIGRLGVRVGGTIECIRETLAETEAWSIDADRFGVLTGSAQQAKDGAVASIRALLDAAIAKEADAARIREAEERLAAEARDLEERQRQDRLAKEERERAEREAAEARERDERLALERREREEREAAELAERQERERVEAEQRQREADERAEREAAEAEERERARVELERTDIREALKQLRTRANGIDEFAWFTTAFDKHHAPKAVRRTKAATAI